MPNHTKVKGLCRRFLGVMLSIAVLSGTSCSKSKDYNLQDINSVGLQVSSFQLSSESDKELSQIFFSIEHKAGEGLITNKTPLGYGKSLTDVTLPISLLGGSGKITVAIGSAAPVEWTSTTKFTIPDSERELTLYVSQSVGGQSYSYQYKVQIRQYTQDPESITWSQEASPFTSLLPAYWSATGMPSGVSLKRVATHGNYTYALGTNGQIYELNGTLWSALAGASGVYELLGALPVSADPTEAPQLQLLVTPARTATLDATLPEGKQAYFASYTASTGIVQGIYAPKDFPGLRTGDFFNAFSSYVSKYVGGGLLLSAAVADPSTAGQSLRQTWFYTEDSHKWAKWHETVVEAALPQGVATVLVDDTYYRLESTGTEFQVYHSTDALSWTKSGAPALLNLGSGLNQATLSAWVDGQTIYVLANSGSPSAALYKGEVLSRQTNY